MKLKPIKQYYRSEGITLDGSGAKVTGTIITKDGQVYCTEGDMQVTVNDKSFSFRLNQNNVSPGNQESQTWDPPTMSTNNVPQGVSAEAIADEFIAFVVSDINS